jgi:hypothetical protein
VVERDVVYVTGRARQLFDALFAQDILPNRHSQASKDAP